MSDEALMRTQEQMAHLEHTVGELDRHLQHQNQVIDALERRCDRLEALVARLQQAAPGEESDDAQLPQADNPAPNEPVTEE